MSVILGCITTYMINYYFKHYSTEIYLFDKMNYSNVRVEILSKAEKEHISADSLLHRKEYNYSLEQLNILSAIIKKGWDESDKKKLLYAYNLVEEKHDTKIDGSIEPFLLSFNLFFLVIFGAICSIMIFLFIEVYKLPERAHKKMEELRKKENNNFNLHVQEVINSFSDTHYLMKGIYNNYPYSFIPYFTERKNGGSPLSGSIYMWYNNVDIAKYSEIAETLLSYSQESVYSTTFFDNNDLVTELNKIHKNNNNSVVGWLEKVNNKKKEIDNFEVKRVHIFKDENEDGDSRKYNSFTELLKKDTNKLAREHYLNYYVGDQSSTNNQESYKIWELSKTKIPCFFGEYIIFDKQIMIKYDEDFRLLEVYVGSIVSKYVEEYNRTTPSFERVDKLKADLGIK